MTDTQQPTNPARPNPLPQRQNGPQTVRIPVTNLVNPQPRRPISKGVPPEEVPEEPWQEKEFDPDEDSGDQASPASKTGSTLGEATPGAYPADQHPQGRSATQSGAGDGESEERSEPIQLPRRPTFARAGEARPELPTRTSQNPQPRPLEGAARQGMPIRTRGSAVSSAENRPSAAAASGSTRPALPRIGGDNSSNSPAASGNGRPTLALRAGGDNSSNTPAPSGSGRPALALRTGSDNSSNTPAAPGSSRPALVPRMELKPVLPVDPERSGVNVIPVPARVLAPPPPASHSGGQPDTAAPVRFTPQSLARRLESTPGAPLGGAAAPTPTLETDPGGALGAPTPANAPSAAPALSAVLEHLVNLPDQTAILGVCDDHLPVLLDLGDPTPGALLVASDDEILRERLMRTLLQTAAALNSPRSVQFLILSTHPADWQAWLDGLDAVRHCLGVDSLVEGSPARWLLKLAGWADQRRTGSSSGPAVILVVDDLAAVSQLEYDARVNFDWLVKEGPGVRIWPVVGLAVERAPELARWVRLFKTRILGPAQDASLYRQLAALDAQESTALLQPAQFAVRIQENWLKFRVPTLPGEKE